MYAIFETRSDIAYVVSIVNRYIFNSNKLHWKVVKRIFWYFRHFLNLRFIFIDVFQLLKDYIDVNWTNNHDIRRFIFDYIFNLKNAIISWFLKRQFTVALSIYKVEYMNQIQTTKKVIWLSELLKKLYSNMTNEILAFNAFAYCFVVTIIYCDNQKI